MPYRLRIISLLLTLALAPLGYGQDVYNNTFAGGRGTLPSEWSLQADPSLQVALDGAGAVRFILQGEGATAGAASLFLTDSGGTDNIQDVRITTRLYYHGLFYRRGIIARTQPATTVGEETGADPAGYYAFVYRAGDIDYLEVARDPKGQEGTRLGRTPLPPLDPGDYVLVFDLEGSRLSAMLYDAEEKTELGRVSAVDATYATGGLGLRCFLNAFHASGKSAPLFRTFQVTASPSSGASE